ncbi:hypothetical protein BU17DRAFT_60281 [Hysterangium stoloniferum]|nr:hypothetical protein BU17DRAFT_60281 [Hysterangium stoloniferum]
MSLPPPFLHLQSNLSPCPIGIYPSDHSTVLPVDDVLAALIMNYDDMSPAANRTALLLTPGSASGSLRILMVFAVIYDRKSRQGFRSEPTLHDDGWCSVLPAAKMPRSGRMLDHVPSYKYQTVILATRTMKENLKYGGLYALTKYGCPQRLLLHAPLSCHVPKRSNQHYSPRQKRRNHTSKHELTVRAWPLQLDNRKTLDNGCAVFIWSM